MKRYIFIAVMAVFCLTNIQAQSGTYKLEGTCGTNTKWEYDGYTLTILDMKKKGERAVIDDYDLKNQKAPWIKKKFSIKKIQIAAGIKRIGSCAFANCADLQEVVFKGNDLVEIGWGAFLNCGRLRNISLPIQLQNIETIAFANCWSLTSLKLPDKCRVGDQAFMSCTNLSSLELSPTTMLGHQVFGNEVAVGNKIHHSLYDGEIRKLPSYINVDNCHEYGLAASAVKKVVSKIVAYVDYDYLTSEVDSFIPLGGKNRIDTYALIIGNQNYRFVSDVPYAIHDARVFAEYCKRTLSIPVENIHISEDATKQMILEEELEDWVQKIPQRENKKLIIYYAGHGVPDNKNHNKAYILPTDVRGTSPQRGIALEDFYGKIGELAFAQTAVFLDACFSGVNRDNEGVSEGLRAVESDVEETPLGDGKVVVFSAAKGNETAQGYPQEGHGLFTYYLLKEMKESTGLISFGELSDNISKKVSQSALQLKMRKQQTPETNASNELTDSWRDLTF